MNMIKNNISSAEWFIALLLLWGIAVGLSYQIVTFLTIAATIITIPPVVFNSNSVACLAYQIN